MPELLSDETASSAAQAVAIANKFWRGARRVAEVFEAPLTAMEPAVAPGENDARVFSFECPHCANGHRLAVVVDWAPSFVSASLGTIGSECGFRGEVQGGRVRWTEYSVPEVDRA